jgi:RimJ/RimL family protein N-acetyltransferase
MEDICEDCHSHPLLELKANQTTLSSERLELRKFAYEDAPALAELANNSKISDMLVSMPHPYFEQHAIAFIKSVENGDHQAIVYAITLKECGTFIGVCELNYSLAGVSAIGYWIGETYWNMDYCTEAIHKLIDEGFGNTHITKISASVRIINGGSRRVLEKCGFRYLGDGLEYSLLNRGSHPMEHHILDRKTWISLKQWK